MKNYNFYVYITTNPNKTTLYAGVTNDLERRMNEHYENRGKPETFAGKYYWYKLVYWEHFQYVQLAIEKKRNKRLDKGQKR